MRLDGDRLCGFTGAGREAEGQITQSKTSWDQVEGRRQQLTKVWDRKEGA